MKTPPFQSQSSPYVSEMRSNYGHNAAGAKVSGDDASTPASHSYTLCLLGDWPQASMKVKLVSSPIGVSKQRMAVHEINTELDSPIVQVSCGSGWLCLLCEDGRAYSCGDNTYGQLGQKHDHPHVSAPIPLFTPFAIAPKRRIMRVSCGSSHGGFVLDGGELYMFGCGSYGRLGTGGEANIGVPTRVQMRWTVLLAAAPNVTSHQKRQDGGEQDDADDDVRFTDISCGDRHTLVLGSRALEEGTTNTGSRRGMLSIKTGVISFGDGMNGRLGLGDELDRHEGALLTTWLASSDSSSGGGGRNTTPPTITAICAGATHNLALSAAGDVFSWGKGVDGQLGHGREESEWTPRQLAFFKNLSATAVCCGASHSIAMSRSGIVYSWGRGAEGQLGVDTDAGTSSYDTGRSVWVPQPVGILKSSTQRVVVRSIAAKQHISLALDDRERLFVWGDNALGQLGLPFMAATSGIVAEVAGNNLVSRPKPLGYSDLRASSSALSGSSSSSRVTSVREHVAAAKLEPIRLGLAHMDAGEQFTLLVFRTKTAISNGSRSISSGGDVQDGYPLSSPGASPPGPKVSAVVNSRWDFTLADELPLSAIPSREATYYEFMANYKVHVRPSNPRLEDGEGGDTTASIMAKDRDRELQQQAARRRERRRLARTSNSVLPLLDVSTAHGNRGSGANNGGDCDSVKEPPTHVHGFETWLGKHSGSPSKSMMDGHSFSLAPRFASRTSKEGESREPAASTSRGSGTARVTGFPTSPVCQPQRPKSVFGRTLSTRRRTALDLMPATVPPSSSSSPGPKPSQQQGNQEASPIQTTPSSHSSVGVTPRAAFGSSVSSRFGQSPPSSSPATPIYPENCLLRTRRAPQFSMGGAEHFSLVISRRLLQAKGPRPGPGTYDRHGG
ncbi:hypothetical protein BBJ28_00002217 [Nothophytophthora sp. Chile5]|nr:hypothetical protein BBJ28_00002217 [Nothophytophthora sp. Chile5]